MVISLKLQESANSLSVMGIPDDLIQKYTNPEATLFGRARFKFELRFLICLYSPSTSSFCLSDAEKVFIISEIKCSAVI